jgi:hypothetical protein
MDNILLEVSLVRGIHHNPPFRLLTNYNGR